MGPYGFVCEGRKIEGAAGLVPEGRSHVGSSERIQIGGAPPGRLPVSVFTDAVTCT